MAAQLPQAVPDVLAGGGRLHTNDRLLDTALTPYSARLGGVMNHVRPAKPGLRYLRWGAVEAATHACTHPAYRDRYPQTKAQVGKTARRQSRPDRPRAAAVRSDLAHAHR